MKDEAANPLPDSRVIPATPLPGELPSARHWIAFREVGTPNKGVTNPAFFSCELEVAGETSVPEIATLLVKPGDGDQCAREIVGANLARIGGLRVPEPGVVSLPEGLIDSLRRVLPTSGRYSNFENGVAVGSWRVLLTPVASVLDLPDERRDEALRLYVYDMLARNEDRAVRNPNCAYTAEGLIVFDFEQCFLMDLRFVPEDVEVWTAASRGGLGKYHMFYAALRGQDVRPIARDLLDRFSQEDLEDWPSRLPDPWRSEARRIVQHIRIILLNAELFLDDLQRSLA